jgi:hypothetical protein
MPVLAAVQDAEFDLASSYAVTANGGPRTLAVPCSGGRYRIAGAGLGRPISDLINRVNLVFRRLQERWSLWLIWRRATAAWMCRVVL